MKNFITILLISLLPQLASAQMERSAFSQTGRGVATTFVRDYQALGINSGNLGMDYQFEDRTVAFGLLEGSYSLYSEPLSKDELRKSIFGGGEDGKFTTEEKKQAAAEFANAGMALDLDLQTFGFHVNTPVGGFALSTRERLHFSAQFSPDITDILFLGFQADYFDEKLDINGNITVNPDSTVSASASVPSPVSGIIEGTRVNVHYYREYNFGYGSKIFGEDEEFAMYGGLGLKYIQGIAIMDINAEGGKLDSYLAVNLPGLLPNDDDSTDTGGGGFSFPKSAGTGFGVDLGLSFVLKKNLTLGIAVNDIGSINYTRGTILQVKDTLFYDSEHAGLDSYNVIETVGGIAGSSGLLSWDSIASKKVALPTNFRLGASYRIGKMLEVGVDFVLPLNDAVSSYGSAILGLGAEFRPTKWLGLMAGFQTGGNYDSKIPVGITFDVLKGAWQIGFASRDAVTFFVDNGPTLSMSFGFFRFRI